MAKLEEFNKFDQSQRQYRYFSEPFKKKKVQELEKNLVSISEICREYKVSRAAIYNWIYKFSAMRKKQERQIVESKSDTVKIKQLKARIKELEQMVGQKQILIEFNEKMIELAGEQLGINIKKKYGLRASSGSGQTEENTPTK